MAGSSALMGHLPESFSGCAWVRIKCAGRTCVGHWGQLLALDAHWWRCTRLRIGRVLQFICIYFNLRLSWSPPNKEFQLSNVILVLNAILVSINLRISCIFSPKLKRFDSCMCLFTWGHQIERAQLVNLHFLLAKG